MVSVLYQSRTVCVEHGQAAVHRLVLLQILFEGKMSHQSGNDLLYSTVRFIVSKFCSYVFLVKYFAVNFLLVKMCCPQ